MLHLNVLELDLKDIQINIKPMTIRIIESTKLDYLQLNVDMNKRTCDRKLITFMLMHTTNK